MKEFRATLTVLIHASIFFAGLTPLSSAQTAPAPASQTPTITGSLQGSRVTVFESPNDSCDPNDIPDSMARAFRDSTGTIHLIAASSETHENLGPTLETVQHSCEFAFNSANNPDPAAFNDQVWLSSFFTLDGNTVAALSHTEYHGWSHPGECHTQNIVRCEYDSDTYHLSTDGGYHFYGFKAPKNFVAGVPYQYKVDWGPSGYSVDSNIISLAGWYYAVTTSWTWPPNCSGSGPHFCRTTGAAPIRTQNVFDPSSWRGWSGTDFSVSFVDPYPGPVSHPLDHVYAPVQYLSYIYGLNIYQPANVAVAVLWDVYDNQLGPQGLYLTTSTDMVNWTKPTLVVKATDLLAHDPSGSYYAYFSLIDPNAPDLNFSIVGDNPYLYFVRLNNNNVYDRVLFRQAIKLTQN